MTTAKAILPPPLVRLLVSAWIAAVVLSLGWLEVYSAAPAEAKVASEAWPIATESPPAQRTLVMFLHPRCPCTRASLIELNEITNHVHDDMNLRVYVVIPPGAPDNWMQGEMSVLATENRFVSVLPDHRALVTAQFGAKTSGETFVYGPDGRLEFHGGITGARGHVGPNAGREAIIELVHSGSAPLAVTPVFGCPLLNELCSSTLPCSR